jgi:hypothetical protein
VKPVLPDIDADRGDHTLQDLSHGVLFSFGASRQPSYRARSTAGPSHYRTLRQVALLSSRESPPTSALARMVSSVLM